MGEPVLTSQLYLYTGQNTYATMMVDKNANNQLTIENMSAGGDINLLTNGGGEVRVNGSPIGLTTNALITDQPLVVPEEGSIVYFDGANNVSTTSTNKLKFDSSNNYILVDGVIQPQRSEIDFLQDEINTLSGNISGLNSSVLALSRRCDSLETITTAQGVDISTLKQDVLDLREEDTLLQTQITDLDGYVATNTTNITSNTTQINSLDVAVNALNSTTISQQSQINTNSSNITTNTINIATNTSDISSNAKSNEL
jgi:peptidoglycan hydrolase CwlO-like protein